MPGITLLGGTLLGCATSSTPAISTGARDTQAPAALLQQHGIAPLQLQAKEGLALINGTQVSTALALHGLFAFEPVLESALVVGALTVDAARGSDGPFDPRIHALRGQPGRNAAVVRGQQAQAADACPDHQQHVEHALIQRVQAGGESLGGAHVRGPRSARRG